MIISRRVLAPLPAHLLLPLLPACGWFLANACASLTPHPADAAAPCPRIGSIDAALQHSRTTEEIISGINDEEVGECVDVHPTVQVAAPRAACTSPPPPPPDAADAAPHQPPSSTTRCKAVMWRRPRRDEERPGGRCLVDHLVSALRRAPPH